MAADGRWRDVQFIRGELHAQETAGYLKSPKRVK